MTVTLMACDFLVGDDEYGATVESLDAHFLPYAVIARRGRQRWDAVS